MSKLDFPLFAVCMMDKRNALLFGDGQASTSMTPFYGIVVDETNSNDGLALVTVLLAGLLSGIGI